MDFDLKNKYFQGIIAIFAFAFFLSLQHVGVKFECIAPDKPCTVRYTNLLGIKREHKLLPAKSIEGISIGENYLRRVSSTRVKLETKYDLDIIYSNGTTKTVFENLPSKHYANEKGKEIMDCVKTEKYPCKIAK